MSLCGEYERLGEGMSGKVLGCVRLCLEWAVSVSLCGDAVYVLRPVH